MSWLLSVVLGRKSKREGIDVYMFFSTVETKTSLSNYTLLSATPWTVGPPAPLSMEFSRREYWGGLPFPPPGDLPDSGIEPTTPESPGCQLDSYHWATWEAPNKSK